jgi:hypothetical protein
MTTTTADDIWAILRELAESRKETELMLRETDRILRESSQETDRRFQETDRILREASQETDRRFQETDRKFQETDRKFQETDRKIKEVNLQLGKLGNRLGDFIEEAVRPSAVRLFRERGIDVHEVHQKIDAQRGNDGIEVDLLVVNDTDVIAIECKSNLSVDDVKDHLERLSKIKRMLPTYADKRIMGAVAAMVIPDAVALYAYRHGLFVIGQNGEQLHIRNKEGFNPAVW